MTPADIITRLIGYVEHDADCAKSKMNSNIIPCTCGYSEVIAEAREFLEGGSGKMNKKRENVRNGIKRWREGHSGLNALRDVVSGMLAKAEEREFMKGKSDDE